jgi:Ca2+/Na+ antiporter
MGAAGLAGTVGAPSGPLSLDILVLLGMTVMVAVFIRTERTISRVEAGIALAAYVGFVVVSIRRG